MQKFTSKNKDVGGITVARSLPQAKLRRLGAWCFLDHAGPARFDSGSPGMQVGAHPHCNLQTFTWMIEGELLHRDSLGSCQTVRPRQVNLMTAGTGNTGISHTEQTPAGGRRLHAVQLWIALPLHQNIAPSFHHYPELPEWSENSTDYILTTGSYCGRRAPTLQYSPLVGVDIRSRSGGTIRLELQRGWEYGLLLISGSLNLNGEDFRAGDLAAFEPDSGSLNVCAEAGCHFLLLGGEPLPHPTVMWWNFVAGNHAALRQAVADWNGGSPRFGTIDLAGTGLQRIAAPEMPASLK